MDIEVLLQATVISAIVSGLFSFFSERRKNKIDCITKEREKWRENLRREIPKIISKCSLSNGNMCISFLNKQEKEEIIEKLSFYRLSINPNDNDDKNLRNLIDILLTGNPVSKDYFLKESCKLLKREWEKGKFEASGLKEKNIFAFCILMLSSIIIIFKNYYELISIIQPITIILLINLVVIFFCLPKHLQNSEEKSNNKSDKSSRAPEFLKFFKDTYGIYLIIIINLVFLLTLAKQDVKPKVPEKTIIQISTTYKQRVK